MARPKTPHPTPAELEVLKFLWDRGPLTVREVWECLREQQQPRAYTSVLSLMNVMAEKGLLERQPFGRAFRYQPSASRDTTLGHMLNDLWQRAFSGSATSLVAHLLDHAKPSEAELQAIRDLLNRFESNGGPQS